MKINHDFQDKTENWQNLSIFNVEKQINIAQSYSADFKGTIVNQESSSFNRDYLKITLCLNEFVGKLHSYCCIDWLQWEIRKCDDGVCYSSGKYSQYHQVLK